jgi:predicted phosphodiesterase
LRKILLLSDTHGFLDEKIIKYANTVDEIWHAGDVGDVTIIDRLKQIKPLRGFTEILTITKSEKNYRLIVNFTVKIFMSG